VIGVPTGAGRLPLGPHALPLATGGLRLGPHALPLAAGGLSLGPHALPLAAAGLPLGPHGLPVAAHVIAVVVGTLLIAAAVRLAVHRKPLRGSGFGRGSVLLVAARLARRIPALLRSTDAALVPTRLAMAPDCWPARWIAAAVHSWQGRSGLGSPPELRTLAAGVRLLCGLSAALSGALAGVLLLGARGAALGMLLLPVGAALPDLVLAAAAQREQRAAQMDAAAVVDMLAATASAGLSLPEAMVLTAGHAPPAAGAALRSAAVRRAMGEEARAAISTEARRFRVPALADVADAMERQRQLGVQLGPELSQIAARFRAEQRAQALQRAARRGPLGTLVVALVIAPVCLAAVIACLVGGLIVSGGLGVH
jgi:hypothetical protein